MEVIGVVLVEVVAVVNLEVAVALVMADRYPSEEYLMSSECT